MQQEVRNLLYMYLADDGPMFDRHQIPSVNEVLRDGKRDKQRVGFAESMSADIQQMFRFSDTDSRALSSDVKEMDDALQRSLKSSVPGLVHMQTADGGQQSVLHGSMATSDDRFSSSLKHRTLIPPNAFNVSTLFQPTLAFIERATSIVPPGFEDETSAFGSVLEDFVVKVFLPQLDEKVTASFQQAVSGMSRSSSLTLTVGYDSFQLDRSLPGSDKPPLKVSLYACARLTSVFGPRHEPHPQSMCHARDDAVSQRELLAPHHRGHCAVLPAVQRQVPR